MCLPCPAHFQFSSTDFSEFLLDFSEANEISVPSRSFQPYGKIWSPKSLGRTHFLKTGWFLCVYLSWPGGLFLFSLPPPQRLFLSLAVSIQSQKIFCSLSGQQEAKLKTNNFWISTARQSECWLRRGEKKKRGGKTLRKEKASWGIWRAAAPEGQGCLVWCGRSEHNLLGRSLGHLINRVIKAPSGPANHNIISDITTQIQGSRGSL